MSTPAGQLFVISAPSGAGKTSLVRALTNSTPGIKAAISHTTRPIRSGEQRDVDYYFVDIDRFQEMIDEDAFLEYARVFDNYYGTSRSAVDQILREGNDVILEIDWQGARKVLRNTANPITVFILPPSREQLTERLLHRGDSDAAVVERRLRAAVDDMSHYNEYDYLIVNDNFDLALVELQAVVRAARAATPVRSKTIRDELARLMAS